MLLLLRVTNQCFLCFLSLARCQFSALTKPNCWVMMKYLANGRRQSTPAWRCDDTLMHICTSKLMHWGDRLQGTKGGPRQSLCQLIRWLHCASKGCIIFAKRNHSEKDQGLVSRKSRKAICEIANCLFWKADLLTCFQGNKKKNNCELWRVKFSPFLRYKGNGDTRKWPVKFRDFRETAPWMTCLSGLVTLHGLRKRHLKI